MAALVIAEHNNHALKPATLNTVTAALACGGEVHVLVAGIDAHEAAKASSQIAGVAKVLHAEAEGFAHGLAEHMAAQVLALASGYSHILFAATASGKNIAPRVAAKLDVGQISDITKVESPDTFERPIYAGNAIATVQATKHFTSSEDFSLPEQISIIVPYGQNEYLLKQWHFSDAPDNLEIARNEYIETEQNNRNPYIDDPSYACHVRFQNMTKWAPLWSVSGNTLTCTDQAISYQWFMNGTAIDGATAASYEITDTASYSVAVQQFTQCPVISSPEVAVNFVAVQELPYAVTGINVYPNPSEGQFTLQANAMSSQQATLRTVDSAGRRNRPCGDGLRQSHRRLQYPGARSPDGVLSGARRVDQGELPERERGEVVQEPPPSDLCRGVPHGGRTPQAWAEGFPHPACRGLFL
jgi:hypothetical protein